ncbi:hypothetical protein BG004_004398 [Podila humilis]|nr:hypothetical protein BG004_004398 [Podila humilis]
MCQSDIRAGLAFAFGPPWSFLLVPENDLCVGGGELDNAHGSDLDNDHDSDNGNDHGDDRGGDPLEIDAESRKDYGYWQREDVIAFVAWVTDPVTGPRFQDPRGVAGKSKNEVFKEIAQHITEIMPHNKPLNFLAAKSRFQVIKGKYDRMREFYKSAMALSTGDRKEMDNKQTEKERQELVMKKVLSICPSFNELRDVIPLVLVDDVAQEEGLTSSSSSSTSSSLSPKVQTGSMTTAPEANESSSKIQRNTTPPISAPSSLSSSSSAPGTPPPTSATTATTTTSRAVGASTPVRHRNIAPSDKPAESALSITRRTTALPSDNNTNSNIYSNGKRPRTMEESAQVIQRSIRPKITTSNTTPPIEKAATNPIRPIAPRANTLTSTTRPNNRHSELREFVIKQIEQKQQTQAQAHGPIPKQNAINMQHQPKQQPPQQKQQHRPQSSHANLKVWEAALFARELAVAEKEHKLSQSKSEAKALDDYRRRHFEDHVKHEEHKLHTRAMKIDARAQELEAATKEKEDQIKKSAQERIARAEQEIKELMRRADLEIKDRMSRLDAELKERAERVDAELKERVQRVDKELKERLQRAYKLVPGDV